MKRKDREITDIEQLDKIIQQCDCCRIALIDGNKPYIVPLNFGYERTSHTPVFYFHGAKEGKKIDLLQQNNQVAIELDTNHLLVSGENACDFSYCYQSVIGTGTLSIITDENERITALQIIMEHYSGKSDWQFSEKTLQATTLLKLEIEEMTGKGHLRKK